MKLLYQLLYCPVLSSVKVRGLLRVNLQINDANDSCEKSYC